MSDQPPIAEKDAGRITIKRPQIYTGPKRLSVDEATVIYLREAATRVRSERYWGSGVTALVSDLLDNAALAIEADTGVTSPGHGVEDVDDFLTAYDNQPGIDTTVLPPGGGRA